MLSTLLQKGHQGPHSCPLGSSSRVNLELGGREMSSTSLPITLRHLLLSCPRPSDSKGLSERRGALSPVGRSLCPLARGMPKHMLVLRALLQSQALVKCRQALLVGELGTHRVSEAGAFGDHKPSPSWGRSQPGPTNGRRGSSQAPASQQVQCAHAQS